MTYLKFNEIQHSTIDPTIKGLTGKHQISQRPSWRFHSIIMKVMKNSSQGRLSIKGGLTMFILSTLLGYSPKVEARPFFEASRALAMGDAYTAIGSGFES